MQKTKENQNFLLNDSGVLFDKEKHEYWLGNNQLTGITGIIGQKLYPDEFKYVDKSILDAKAERGTQIHKDFENYDEFGICENDIVTNYRNSIQRKKVRVLASEYIVTDRLKYASPIDKVVIIDNEIYLADVKCVSRLNKEKVGWQLSIYKKFFLEQNPDLKVKGLLCIHVKDNGQVRIIDIPEISDEKVHNLLYGGELTSANISMSITEDEASEIINSITTITRDIKSLTELKNSFESQLREVIKDAPERKWDTEKFRVSIGLPYERRTFDSERFETDNPELAEKYYKTATVLGRLTYKLK